MAVEGETIATGAPIVCPDCHTSVLPLRVLLSNAGWYIGTICKCGPYTRESGYYRTRIEAQEALVQRTYGRP